MKWNKMKYNEITWNKMKKKIWNKIKYNWDRINKNEIK